MKIFTCEPTLEAMLTCIHVAWSSRLGHKNIGLMLEPIYQYTLFDEYIHVDPDEKKVNSIIDAVNLKISPYFFTQMAYSSMAYEPDILENIYHCMILGFHLGPRVLEMVQYEDIMQNQLIRTRLGREINRFQEVLRFHKLGEIYIAHFEPKSRICAALGPIFEDRLPSEHWMIVDDLHREAVIHVKDQPFYLQKLTEEEVRRLLESDSVNDEYTRMWKTFFNSVAIKERTNKKLQQSLFPAWARKHAAEFN